MPGRLPALCRPAGRTAPSRVKHALRGLKAPDSPGSSFGLVEQMGEQNWGMVRRYGTKTT
ncbi:uncharacterized protein BO72DRAFT_501794 [Aspergillus fijiensis CBS 313.89]|uniref:Uncharacterized protein n=1 Tax=Aspergillus fijiensis CBS 313.89 TaxID=1448319 RepID=A0A8G1VTZ5_9EURO|nr:uncharacterized protein BO72DRAFT_501794 [Aspergillus fijiensis CBS 313.89]RAK71553.1 hypothetical protein BO72DRAFT_501794 [Aspergillus fijiensis CBS 313.89]